MSILDLIDTISFSSFSLVKQLHGRRPVGSRKKGDRSGSEGIGRSRTGETDVSQGGRPDWPVSPGRLGEDELESDRLDSCERTAGDSSANRIRAEWPVESAGRTRFELSQFVRIAIFVRRITKAWQTVASAQLARYLWLEISNTGEVWFNTSNVFFCDCLCFWNAHQPISEEAVFCVRSAYVWRYLNEARPVKLLSIHTKPSRW